MWQTICQKVIFFSWWNLWALRPCSLSFRSRPAAKTIHNPIRFENRKYPRERNFGYAIFVYQTLIIYVLVMKIFNRCPYHLVNSLARWAGCGEILRYLGAEIFKSAYQKADSPTLFSLKLIAIFIQALLILFSRRSNCWQEFISVRMIQPVIEYFLKRFRELGRKTENEVFESHKKENKARDWDTLGLGSTSDEEFTEDFL